MLLKSSTRFLEETENKKLSEIEEYFNLTTQLKSLPDKNGKTAFDVAEFILKQSGGEDIDERLHRLLELDIDDEFHPTILIFTELSKRRAEPDRLIPFSEIDAWCRLTDTTLTPLQLKTINSIDSGFTQGVIARRAELNALNNQ